MPTANRALLAALALALAPGAAHAADEEGALDPGASYLTGRLGAFLLTARGVPGTPAGPDAEVTAGRVVLPGVALEVAGGGWRVRVASSDTTVTVLPVTLSVKLFAPLEHGFQPYAVAGGGLYWTRLALDATQASAAMQDERWSGGFHAGLGALHRLGERLVVGVDFRYVLLEAHGAFAGTALSGGTGPNGARLDGVRLSASAGLAF
jgi:opacity protein-like surface antigen